MKKIFILLFVCFSVGIGKNVCAQFATQSFQMGSLPAPADVATDPDNNILVSGGFTLPTNTTTSILIKYAPDASVLWSADAVSPSNMYGQKVCTDSAGNAFVLGGYHNPTSTDSAQLVGGPVWNTTGYGIFLAKYSAAGTLLWVTPITAGANSHLAEIACNNQGEVTLVGFFAGGITIGATVLPGQGGFMAKFSGSGNVVWAMQTQGPDVSVSDVAYGLDGNIVIAGSYFDTLAIDGFGAAGSTGQNFFLANLSAAGNILWLKTTVVPGGMLQDFNIDTDSAGAVYASGRMTAFDVPFGPFILTGGTYNTFLVKYSAAGDVKWAKQLGNIQDDISPRAMVVHKQGNVFLGGEFSGSVTIGSVVVTTQTGSYDLFLCKADTAGNVVWAISGGVPNYMEQLYGLALNQTDKCYITGMDPSMGVQNPFTFGGLSTVNDGAFLYEININAYNQIKGKVFIDLDSDTLMDMNEAAAAGIVLQANSGYYVSGSDGMYSVAAGSGTTQITVPVIPLYYSLAPSSHSVTFSGYGNVDTTRHFALQPMPGMQDLEVHIATPVPPRPGFGYPIYVTYRNVGTTTMSGSVELVHDTALVFQSSFPAYTATVDNLLAWDFTNLAPTQSATIVVNTQLPATAILGSLAAQIASVLPYSGDLTSTNNIAVDTTTIVGSYDPNDKQVNHTSLTPTEVQNEKWLEYTIRFQNTGTDTAFTVRLADTLSAMLNISTIEVLASSHAHTWSIKGTGIMEFRFDNILLPDSNTNEPASHGFVKYRIKPKTTLALGDVIENTAYIYFDFNAPIVTNTATTEVSFVNAVATLERNPLHIYPNPNNGTFTLQCSNISAPQVQAELRNVLGQIVWQQNLAVENGKLQQVVRTSGLSRGVYFLQVKTEKGSKVQKVIME